MRSGAAGSAIDQRRRLRAWLAGVALVSMAGTAAGELPPPGRHTGLMCVHAIGAAPDPRSCGPVEIWLLRNDLAVVRISDIAYRIMLHPDALDVVLMHGAMQIDEFTTLYRWQGATLRFDDRDKGMRYQIDFMPSDAGSR